MTTSPRSAGAGPPVGYYTYAVGDDCWIWSDGIYALHGYAPYAVPAATETLLRHKHPDDRARILDVMEAAVRTGLPFSCYHRIIDSHGAERSVLTVGRGMRGDTGRVESLVGFYVDLTEVRRTEAQADVEVALTHIAEHRAVIEQAKGVLMFATGCDSDAAFDVLRRYSMAGNVKLHHVARHLLGATGQELSAGSATGASVLAWLDRLVPTPRAALDNARTRAAQAPEPVSPRVS